MTKYVIVCLPHVFLSCLLAFPPLQVTIYIIDNLCIFFYDGTKLFFPPWFSLFCNYFEIWVSLFFFFFLSDSLIFGYATVDLLIHLFMVL